MEDGQTVRMPIGKKEIFITFRVEKSDYFRRDGSDVHTDVAISLAQAILGGSTRIQGIYENMTIDVSSSPLETIPILSRLYSYAYQLFHLYIYSCTDPCRHGLSYTNKIEGKRD